MTTYEKKVKKQEFISSVKKSQKKMNIMLANSTNLYEKIKAVRPLFLKIIEYMMISNTIWNGVNSFKSFTKNLVNS